MTPKYWICIKSIYFSKMGNWTNCRVDDDFWRSDKDKAVQKMVMLFGRCFAFRTNSTKIMVGALDGRAVVCFIPPFAKAAAQPLQ